MRFVKYYPASQSFAPAYGLSARGLWTGLESEIDRLLNGTASLGADFPVDLQEDKDNAYVRAELPGVKREDIKVAVTQSLVKVSLEYTIPVDLLFYSTELHFTPSSENKSLF